MPILPSHLAYSIHPCVGYSASGGYLIHESQRVSALHGHNGRAGRYAESQGGGNLTWREVNARILAALASNNKFSGRTSKGRFCRAAISSRTHVNCFYQALTLIDPTAAPAKFLKFSRPRVPSLIRWPPPER
jgi:hypothetical protein